MALTPEQASQTRTSAIVEEIRKRIESRRSIYDTSRDLGELQITVRLVPGSNVIRSVTVKEELIIMRTRDHLRNQ